MGNKKYYNSPKTSLALQAMHLRKEYPESRCSLHCGELIWWGEIRPTPLSRTYKIRIECHELQQRPRVILYGDHIEGIDRRGFPHHFEIDREKNEVILCLHMPYEFDHRCWIADTIIPWTQEWLYFYEIWLATGEWCGGGHIPKAKQNKRFLGTDSVEGGLSEILGDQEV